MQYLIGLFRSQIAPMKKKGFPAKNFAYLKTRLLQLTRC